MQNHMMMKRKFFIQQSSITFPSTYTFVHRKPIIICLTDNNYSLFSVCYIKATHQNKNSTKLCQRDLITKTDRLDYLTNMLKDLITK